MKKSDGMLVSREYLERLDAAVFGTKAEPAPTRRRSSDFYRQREVKQTGSWTSAGGEYYKTTARFIDDNGDETGNPIEIYKRAEQTPETETGPLWVTLRGRWEVMTAGGGEPLRPFLSMYNDDLNYLRIVIEYA